MDNIIFKLADNQDRCNILGDLEIGSDPTETLRVTCPSVKEQPLSYVFRGVTHLVFYWIVMKRVTVRDKISDDLKSGQIV